MHFIGTCLEKLEGWIQSFSVEVFASVLKPQWIDEALQVTGRGTKRKRKLTAPFTIWLVIGMAFYRNLSITNILRRMGSVLGMGSLWEKGETPRSSSNGEARDRIGIAPIRWLAEKLAQWILSTYREAMSWKGWLLLAVDGTTFKVPDSEQNRRRFGLPGFSRGRSAFPQMRAAFLVSTRLHFILNAVFAPYRRHEKLLARRLLPSVPKRSLVLLDRGLDVWRLLLGIQDRESHFLVRMLRTIRGTRAEILGPGDYLVDVKLPRKLRRQDRSLPRAVCVRELTVRIRGRWYRFFTSLLDSVAYPAVELVRLYTQRWEEEIAFDEIKIHQCGTTTVNRPVLFRCQSTRRVLQEAYGLVLAYNLIRILMAQAALRADISPLRISFVDSLERIRQAALLMAAAPTATLPALFEDLLRTIATCVNPPRRDRKNPRVVCVKMSHYQLKKKRA